MSYSVQNHLLYKDGKQVPYMPSPNHAGPLHPSYLIMHYTGSTSGDGCISWFKSTESKVSAHLLICRDGSITQFLPFNVVGYHAGKSSWKGIQGLNQHSIGIELLNAGILSSRDAECFCQLDNKKVHDFVTINGSTWQTYPDVQIEVTRQVNEVLTDFYHLTETIGHSDISPGRKVDPGPAFPWDKIRSKSPVQNTATSATAGKNTRKVASKEGLNLRSGPGTQFKVLETYRPGTEVTVMEEKDGWSYVDSKGWLRSSYLN